MATIADGRPDTSGLTLTATRRQHSTISQRNTPELLRARATLRRARGKPDARSIRSPCAKGRKHTVVTTVAPVITRPSPRNGFNGFLRAPRRRIPFVTVVTRIDGAPSPVGPTSPPRDLASATDARTTRLRRPRQHRSSCAPVIRSRLLKAAPRNHLRARATASTASQPALVTILSRPSCG